MPVIEMFRNLISMFL